jgi:hypothetical protein
MPVNDSRVPRSFIYAKRRGNVPLKQGRTFDISHPDKVPIIDIIQQRGNMPCASAELRRANEGRAI